MYYSTGMKQKMIIARGLLANPEILLLDEPTRSLDPLVSQNLWHFIRKELVGNQGKTILLATHNLDEARRECDRVAVLHQGEIKATGTVLELTNFLAGTVRYHLTFRPSGNGVVSLLSAVPGVHDVRLDAIQDGEPHNVEFTVEDPDVQVPQLLRQIMAAGGEILACAPRER